MLLDVTHETLKSSSFDSSFFFLFLSDIQKLFSSLHSGWILWSYSFRWRFLPLKSVKRETIPRNGSVASIRTQNLFAKCMLVISMPIADTHSWQFPDSFFLNRATNFCNYQAPSNIAEVELLLHRIPFKQTKWLPKASTSILYCEKWEKKISDDCRGNKTHKCQVN